MSKSWTGWLSKSQIHMYERCPYSWYLSKVVKVEPEKRPELMKGKSIHEILNWVYSQKDKFESLDDLTNELMKHPEAKDYENKIHSFANVLNNWTLEHPYLREEKIFDKDYAVVGIVDRVDDLDGKKIVVEYKSKYSKYQLENYKFELALYAFLLQKHKNIKINDGAVIFLKEGLLKKIDLSDEMKQKAIDHVLDVRGKIFRALPEKKFERNKTNFCNYCQFKTECEKRER